jgi:hypothetical protein
MAEQLDFGWQRVAPPRAPGRTLATVIVLIDVLFVFGAYYVGRIDGGLYECRRQWTTVETAAAVWTHCDRKYLPWKREG